MLVKYGEDLLFAEQEVNKLVNCNIDKITEGVTFQSWDKKYEALNTSYEDSPEEFILKNIAYNKEILAMEDDDNIVDTFLTIIHKQGVDQMVLPVYEIDGEVPELFIPTEEMMSLFEFFFNPNEFIGLIAGTKDEIDYTINLYNTIANEEDVSIVLHKVDYCPYCKRFEVIDNDDDELLAFNNVPYAGMLDDESEIRNYLKKYTTVEIV